MTGVQTCALPISRKDLLKVRRLGGKGADEVGKILDRFGLSLGMAVE